MTTRTRRIAAGLTLAWTVACSNAAGPKSTACATGSGGTTGSDSSISWRRVTVPTGQRLSAVKITGIATGVAVGDSGTYLIYGGGNSWAAENVGPTRGVENFYGVEATAAGEVWIVGDSGLVLHAPTLTGGWVQQTTNVGVTLFAVWHTGTELFAAGNGGVIIHSTNDGANWSTLAGPTSDTLMAIAGPKDSVLLAVGAGGAGAAYDGSTWSVDQTGTSVDLRALGTAADTSHSLTDVWAVGDHGTIIHSASGASGTWSAQTSGSTQSLFAIAVDSSAHALVAGAGGTILHWDGAVWRVMSTPTHADLRGVARGLSAPVDYWAVGSCGTVLHGTGS